MLLDLCHAMVSGAAPMDVVVKSETKMSQIGLEAKRR